LLVALWHSHTGSCNVIRKGNSNHRELAFAAHIFHNIQHQHNPSAHCLKTITNEEVLKAEAQKRMKQRTAMKSGA